MLFKEVIGQEKIKNRLIQTVKDNRVSHAQLFLGPEGSGKLSMALAYAQFINCKNKQENDSCGVCPSCVKFNKLIHPDLHFIYPVASTKNIKKPQSKEFISNWRNILEKNNYHITLNDWYEEIGIERKQGIINKDDCNEIIKTLAYKSYEAEYKVMFIWMVERLFHAAAPKILKILEEPPEKTLFILISENQDRIINTILSRTQLVKFPKITDESLNQALIKKHNCSVDDFHRIVNLSDGNYIEAKNNLYKNTDDKTNFDNFRNWMRLCYSNNVIEVNTFVTDISKIGREKQKQFLNFALKTTRNCILKNYNNTEMLKLEDDELKFVNNFAPFINPANCMQFSEEFEKSIFHIERNGNPSIIFMDLSLKVIQLLRIKVK